MAMINGGINLTDNDEYIECEAFVVDCMKRLECECLQRAIVLCLLSTAIDSCLKYTSDPDMLYECTRKHRLNVIAKISTM